MTNKRMGLLCRAFTFFVLALPLVVGIPGAACAAKKPVYRIKPNSAPTNITVEGRKTNPKGFRSFNKYTRQYYMVLSYLQRLEEEGGGTLVLRKGSYKITNSLRVPSNVTVILNDGVLIQKGTKTGGAEFDAAESVFHLVSSKHFYKKGFLKKYKGAKNIKIIGKGNATIDLGNIMEAKAIVAGHNKNVTIRGVRFKNLNSGHFIEMDAVDGALISNNRFENSIVSKDVNKEAINLDTPDPTTGGFNLSWSGKDKTPNKNVVIEDNYFYNLDRGVGTHKYSQKKDQNGNYTRNMYHANITIRNNKFVKTRSNAIRVMNWKNVVIEGNEIANVLRGTGRGSEGGIFVSGTVGLTIRQNVFNNMSRGIVIGGPWKNTGSGSQYSEIYNDLGGKSVFDLEDNVFKKVSEHRRLP